MFNRMCLLTATKLVPSGAIVQNTGMSANDWLAILIPALVTLFGFLFTFFSLRKSFKDEIAKNKSNLALDKMSTIPFETLDLYETIMAPTRIEKQIKALEENKNISRSEQVEIQKMKAEIKKAQDIMYDKMSNLYNTIYAYGSLNAIKIVSSMQKANYRLKPESTNEERYTIIAYMILLASQVKQDVTDITVNPKQWFEMKITDYDSKKDSFDPLVNKVIDELDLDIRFKILL